ncbi:asparagine synthase C-terminal domain-containing protein [Streptomyces sp. NPDC048717]|uniref:asparagine synthase C-terminal domain-containing protein n=1 Tax=Streptomyces sp. NPDC048717 TaxID=3154928 RepID=UPI00343145C2
MAGFLLSIRPDGAAEVELLGQGLGMDVLVRREGSDVLVVQGDRLTAEEPPVHAPFDALTAWAERAHSRYCAVLVREGRATLWSDVGATSPLHWARSAGALLVGTSAGAMLPLLGAPAVLGDAERSLLPGGRFAGITAVPANSAVTVVADAYGDTPVSVRRLAPLPDRPSQTDPDRAVRAVRRVLGEAVVRLAADADEIGVSLSGGVDSSTVTALAVRELGAPAVRTYTVGTPFGDEFEQAAWLAARLGTKHEEILFGPGQLAAMLPGMIRALETWDVLTLQIAAPACFLQDHIATGDRRVLLSGYGADLLFAGLGGTGGERAVEAAVVAQTFATARSNEFHPAFADARHAAVRHPYWTREVMTAALDIRGRLKVHEGTAKWVLRSAAADVLPAEVAWRPKRGIHEGTAMSRMFAAALGSEEPAVQARMLRDMATEIFRDGGSGAVPGSGAGVRLDDGAVPAAGADDTMRDRRQGGTR